jgi:outer membrane protein insertion porin family
MCQQATDTTSWAGRVCVLGVCASILCSPAAFAQGASALTIRRVEVRHVGPPAVSDALIRANIRVKEGESYNRNSVDDDVRSLYGTGYFYNIRVVEEAVEEGVRLVYVVQGKPTLTQIIFSGNKKYKNTKLLKKVSSKTGEPLDERKLFSDAQEIQKYYQKAGYQKTTVKYVPNVDERLGKGTATFEINESPKVKIRDVVFVGAEAFSQKKLRKTIKTRRHWMFSWLTGSGTLKDEQFEEDKEKLAEFYRNEGYIDFEIKDIQVDQYNEKRIVLKISVFEGRRYRVGSVDFRGNKLFTTNALLYDPIVKEKNKFTRGLTLSPGQNFTPNSLGRDREALEDLYGAKGYIDARIEPVRIPNTERGTMDVVYQIEEGEKSYIEKIEIKGNTKTKDKVIRRELAINPGETFDMVRVKLSTNRLYGLNYFAKVDAQPEPTDVPDRRNLSLTVEEKNTGDLRFGVGFSSVDSLVGFVEVGQGNFDLFKPPYFLGTGGGQKVRLRVQYGTERQDYQLTFIEPWFLNHKLAFGVDLYYRQLNYYSDLYDLIQGGARLSLSRVLWNDFWIGSVSYTLENIGLVDMPRPFEVVGSDGQTRTYDPVPPEIRLEEGYTLVSKAGTSIAYDTRNSVLLPDRGQRTVFEAFVAGGPLGGDTDFYKLEVTSSRYFRGFAKGHVLELSGRVGVVDTYANSDRVHLFDRFFLGGLYSLRGFEYRHVGPFDATGVEPIGGGTFWFGTAEYSIPIIERLRFAVFYDAGNVYPKAYSFDVLNSDYKSYLDNWGLGIRLNIPMVGPLRLDYAFPITVDKFNEDKGRFQFGVGYTREF